MKQFIYRGIVFLLIAFVGLGIVARLRVSPYFISYGKDRKGGWVKVHERINRSRQKGSFKKVYIGDSVGNQLFDFDSVPNSLCSNAAVNMAGNFILINNLLENNPDIKEIILASVPNDIGWNFEQKLTHNNFVKPFLLFRHLKYFDTLLRSKLWEEPVSWLYLFYAVKVLPISDINFAKDDATSVTYLEEIKLTTLSDLAVDYLQKLHQLCEEKGIRLQLISPPVPQHWDDDTNHWTKMRAQVDSLGLQDIFGDYFNTIEYYPDAWFLDGLHLKERFIPKARREFLSKENGVGRGEK